MFDPIRLEIPTVVKPKQRARSTRLGRHYTPQETVSFEAELRWHWKASGKLMIPKCPTAVTIGCYILKPPSTAKSVLLPITKPDLDNCAKSILDALNGFAWLDDNQITYLNIFKRYGDAPRISIAIKHDVFGVEECDTK